MGRKKSDVTLLVVEDDRLFRESVIVILRKCGFKILSAAGGNEALELLKTNTVDLILSDFRMPEGDGIHLLDTIRKVNPEIPVLIFLTGFGDLSPKECVERGAHRVLSKPCSRATLLGAIDEALGLDKEAQAG